MFSLQSALLVALLVGIPGSSLGASLDLSFDAALVGTLQDVAGQGIGLTDRLPGTGATLPGADGNLDLDTAAGVLRIQSTNSDLNGQLDLDQGEYLGVALDSLGFTGVEDFEVRATFLDIQYSETFDQFGLYVGSDSDTNFRGGYLFFDTGQTSFAAHNADGTDSDRSIGGGFPAGSSIELALQRTAGAFFLTFNGTPLLFVEPDFLNGPTDLQVGIFAANAGNTTPKPAIIDDFFVNVVEIPEPGGCDAPSRGAFRASRADRTRGRGRA